MMKRFAALSVIALMLGAVPAAFAAGAGSSGSSSGSGAPGAPSGSGTNPGMGTQPAPGGALQNSPRGTNDTTPGTTQPRAAGPVSTPSEASTALQSRGYSNVQGLVRSGDVYRGRAVRDGRTVMVEIDARTGAVREVSG